MNKTNKILIAVVAVLILALGGVLAWREWGGESPYYAVSLRTGDVYFGRLTRFPAFGLKQVYLVQMNQNDPKNPFSVQRFKNAFWGPEDFLRINRDEVVWMARLDPQGQLARLIKTNPELAPATPASPQVPAPAPEASTPNK
ncbi:hypothetical protein COU12_01825 [Candidatus Jorgensenbacteria bacterium CG10_big_fil_rev_8_21_14_0_10_54_38]|uniref:Uncharacterized protein n=2 Tax=Candidatus Joergenseniibacteriota TaxID=1752739 RepID=A0A2M6WFY0_9BACT|nr:MAG: hypothetical protein COX26_00160 [Candidatus Jorgensenbacteria bacterium CG23_combo_of_CG06-09_8_20_14_all_54_14]PIT91667.1 MAG: hypothetical protein COU12_01825 [Candidatus Jorgensenbacteria bacterium CG10_big_fil_rev_8_21_14_0_10_54_38]